MTLTSQTLAGRVALVTGGGRGIGRATALDLAAAGARVAVPARSAHELAQTAALVGQRGGGRLLRPEQSAASLLAQLPSAATGQIWVAADTY